MASSEPFTEITDALGLNFEHRNSDWLSRLIRSYVLKEDEQLARLAIPPAFGGAGVAAGDIDNDGWDDILLLGGMGNALYKNDGGQRFIDITSASGLSLSQVDGSYGEPRQPIIVDFNNDGLQDILITYVNAPHQLYKNLGGGNFEAMSEHAGLGGTGLVGGPATAFDFDRDGLLDVYIGYFGNYLDGQLPTLKRHNDNGSPNLLFKNMGNFKFEDVSRGSGTENAGWTQAVGHSDFNGDGWQDLIVGNDFGTNAYYLNMRDGSFKDISEDLGTNKPSYTMNIGIADLNKDFLPDFYISNIVVMEKDDKYVLPNQETVAHFDINSLKTMRVIEANDLFLSSRDATDSIYYINSTAVDRGFGNTGWSWDADFFDFDLDGDEDLYCVTGMNPYSVYGQENEYYSGQDSARKPVTFASSQEDRNVLFVNEKGKLNLVEDVGGLNYIGTSRSAAFFDFDHDGDLDVVVNDYQGKARLFRNNADQTRRGWVNIDLKSNVADVTRDAIGAVVILRTPDGGIQWKEVHSTTGYLSVHPKQLNFGLGENATFDLEIRWPDGQVQMIPGLVRNQFYQFTESP
jgi:hypothetical protein